MKNILLVIIAIGFSIAQAAEPKYDDDNRCNVSNATLAEGIYIPSGSCQQTGFDIWNSRHGITDSFCQK